MRWTNSPAKTIRDELAAGLPALNPSGHSPNHKCANERDGQVGQKPGDADRKRQRPDPANSARSNRNELPPAFGS
jgi:hypothetical protein